MVKLGTFSKKLQSNLYVNNAHSGTRKGRVITNKWLLNEFIAFDPGLKKEMGDSISITKAIDLFARRQFAKKPSPLIAKMLLKAFGRLIPAIYGNESYKTQTALMKSILDYVRDAYGETSDITAAAYTMMHVDAEEHKKRAKEYSDKIDELNRGKRRMFDPDTVYGAINNAANSDHWPTVAVGVELATGARIGEILAGSSFEPSPDKDDHIVQNNPFKQNKTARYKKNMTKKEFETIKKELDDKRVRRIEKPVIRISVQQALDMIAFVREALKGEIVKIEKGEKTAYELSQSRNGTINAAVRKLFPDAPKKGPNKVTSHVLRKIYGSLAYTLVGSAGKSSEAGYLSQILGHRAGSVQVASSYSTVAVKSDTITPVERKHIEAKFTELSQKESSTDDRLSKIEQMLENLNISINKKGNEGKISVDETLVSVPRNIRLKNGRVMDRIAESARVMREKGVALSTRNFRALGYGSATISRWRKMQREQVKQDEEKKPEPRRSARIAKNK